MAKAVTPGKLMDELETLVSSSGNEEFIYGFLSAYGLPKGTITQLRNGGSRNIATEPGAVGLKQKIYFLPLEPGESASNRLESMEQSPAINRNKIRFAVTTDFESFLALDLKTGDLLDIEFLEIPRNFSFFLPLAGMEKVKVHNEAEADVKAAERMGRLCDLIRDKNPVETEEQRHSLNVFLTRLLFCYYAEDTGIFGENQFTEAVKANTADDGLDTHEFLASLFDALDRAPNDRDNLPSHLAAFPYVNGGLFETAYPVPIISRNARRILLDAGALDWRETNPDIFGSMFQAVIDPSQRGELGQHYTSVTNILKVIRPLFLDSLEQDIERATGNEKRLMKLLARLGTIKVFDPACGSGNFLIIAYKELRRLEIKVFKALDALSQPQEFAPSNQNRMFSDLDAQPQLRVGRQQEMWMSGISLDQFYGIELDDFAHEVAKLALWIAEHQMQQEFRAEFGYAAPTLPLREGGNVTCGNSLRLDWTKVCEKSEGDEIYLCGNPPFVGSGRERTQAQNDDLAFALAEFDKYKDLDLVTGWFWKACQYIGDNSTIHAAFVSTSSITQGEQVPLLWPHIFSTGIQISFAYQSFKWKNNAKDNAATEVVIIGLSRSPATRRIFSLTNDHWVSTPVPHISAYLHDGDDTIVLGRRSPISDISPVVNGSIAADGGYLILTEEQRAELLAIEPQAARWIRKYVGGDDLISGNFRYCLWLVDAPEAALRECPHVLDRIAKVREKRLQSPKVQTQAKAQTSHLFTEIRQPSSGEYLAIPRTSSENRDYLPIAYVSHDVVANNDLQIVPNATKYEFGVVSSEMHMDWLRLVGGRLEGRFRYSTALVYNTFPWPTPTEKLMSEIEDMASAILQARESHFHLTLGELYDRARMPEDLRSAHREMDNAVEKLYGSRGFTGRTERQNFLLALYNKQISGD